MAEDLRRRALLGDALALDELLELKGVDERRKAAAEVGEELRKAQQRQKRPVKKAIRIPKSDLAPPLKQPVDPMKLYGMPWAVKNGFAHIKKCSKKDARIIVKALGLSPSETPEEHNTAFGELVVLEFPWRWLEKFDKAGGDFAQLSIRSKFPSSYI